MELVGRGRRRGTCDGFASTRRSSLVATCAFSVQVALDGLLGTGVGPHEPTSPADLASRALAPPLVRAAGAGLARVGFD